MRERFAVRQEPSSFSSLYIHAFWVIQIYHNTTIQPAAAIIQLRAPGLLSCRRSLCSRLPVIVADITIATESS